MISFFSHSTLLLSYKGWCFVPACLLVFNEDMFLFSSSKAESEEEK